MPDSEAGRDWSTAPIDELIVHIVNRHHTFLRRQLPRIEVIFDRIVGKKPDETGGIVLPLGKLFLGLRTELESHLLKEENVLFPYILRLEDARKSGSPTPKAHFGSVKRPIGMMEHEHDSADRVLQEMRRLTNGYPMEGSTCSNWRELFRALGELETDLVEHIRLENEILHPRAIRLEAECACASGS
jgi:regulator of cell morphogenesis and NO signaling